MKNFFLFFALVGCCMISSLYAVNVSNVDVDSLIEKCAEKIIDDHVYLKPGVTFVSEKDIFLTSSSP